jgi:hypothetical protein
MPRMILAEFTKLFFFEGLVSPQYHNPSAPSPQCSVEKSNRLRPVLQDKSLWEAPTGGAFANGNELGRGRSGDVVRHPP